MELVEVNLACTNLSKDSINFLTNNLTRKIEKLSLCNLSQVTDRHVKALAHRCNKIKTLDLHGTYKLTVQTMNSVLEHLKPTLEELCLPWHGTFHNFDISELPILKTMPKLKILASVIANFEKIKTLDNHTATDSKHEMLNGITTQFYYFAVKLYMYQKKIKPFGIFFH